MKIQRVFLDFGGLGIEDAEATVLDDTMRSAGLRLDQLGDDATNGLIENQRQPGNGVSRLCKE